MANNQNMEEFLKGLRDFITSNPIMSSVLSSVSTGEVPSSSTATPMQTDPKSTTETPTVNPATVEAQLETQVPIIRETGQSSQISEKPLPRVHRTPVSPTKTALKSATEDVLDIVPLSQVFPGDEEFPIDPENPPDLRNIGKAKRKLGERSFPERRSSRLSKKTMSKKKSQPLRKKQKGLHLQDESESEDDVFKVVDDYADPDDEDDEDFKNVEESTEETTEEEEVEESEKSQDTPILREYQREVKRKGKEKVDVGQSAPTPKPTTRSSTRPQPEPKPVNESDSDYNISPGNISDFYCLSSRKRWDSYKIRNFRIEKRIDSENFKKYRVYQFLVHRGLISTVTSASPFAGNVIHLFYCNLSKKMLDKHSKKYGKVFLRGRVFHFTPEIINDQFGLENIVQEGVCDDFGEIVRKITCDKLKKWPKRLKASRLTSFYFVLHKIAISNWLPSKNTTVVTAEQATLLYKIGCGVRFNFGQLVFDQIGRMAERLSSGLLPFPSLIYQILVTQGFKPNKEDIFIKLLELFVITRVLLIGDRVVDLPWVNEEIHAGDESPADDVAKDVADPSGSKISMPKKLILQQIKALSKQISELTQIRDTLLEAFSSQKGGDGDDADVVADVAGPSQKGNEEKAAEAEGEESDDGNGDDETAADSESEEF